MRCQEMSPLSTSAQSPSRTATALMANNAQCTAKIVRSSFWNCTSSTLATNAFDARDVLEDVFERLRQSLKRHARTPATIPEGQ